MTKVAAGRTSARYPGSQSPRNLTGFSRYSFRQFAAPKLYWRVYSLVY